MAPTPTPYCDCCCSSYVNNDDNKIALALVGIQHTISLLQFHIIVEQSQTKTRDEEENPRK
jgi:hypothetical protein